ncbi:MAG: HDOD domain-containing protein [Candidatus Muiribacteriota bacterium]
MKSIIVDKDEKRLKELKNILSEYSDVKVFKSGKKAFTFFKCDESSDVDIVFISDFLKDFDNTAIISQIRKKEADQDIDEENKLLIIILSEKPDKKKVFEFYRCGCSGLLISPLNAGNVYEKINTKLNLKKEGAKNLYKNVEKAYIKSDIDLPTLPDIYFNFKDLLDNDASSEDIGELLKQDITISAKIISLSNSAYFGGIERNSTVKEAVNRLGLSETHQLVSAVCSKKLFVTQNKRYSALLSNLFDFSISIAFATQAIAEHLNISKKGYPFEMGLLSNIGRLFMIVIVAEMERKKMNGKELSIDVAVSVIEKHHYAFASKILSEWEFSPEFVNTSVNYIYNPSAKKSLSPIASVILLSLYAFCENSVFGPDYSLLGVERIIEEENLDIKADDIEDIKKRVKEMVSMLEV